MASFDEYEYLERQVANGTASGSQRAADGEAEREPDRKKSRERSRERSRDRKSSRDRTDRDRDRDRDRRRDRDRDFRDSRDHRDRDYRSSRDYRDRREYDRPRPNRDDPRGGRPRTRSPPRRRREATPPEVRLQREKERELAELERLTRTVFVYNLNIKADERDIFDFFGQVVGVKDIKIITDRHTKRSKGLAYVELDKQEQVFVALAMSGQVLMGQPVMVKPAEAEKNLAWEAQQAAKASTADPGALLGLGTGLGMPGLPDPSLALLPMKLQITGFKAGLGEGELRQIMEPFGSVDSVTMVKDGAGQPVGIAYVVFRSGLEAQTAATYWNGRELLNTTLNVTVAPLTAAEGGPVTTVGELDEDEDSFKLNSSARAALMSRLAGSAGLAPPPGAAAAAAAGGPAVDPVLMLEQGLLGPSSPIPTPCLLLKNMFDPTQETEPNWVQEVTDDVRDEAAKFGEVQHIWVDPNSKGFVYIKFAAVEAAQAAHRVFHGRFYQGHQIVVEYQFAQPYSQHFGL